MPYPNRSASRLVALQAWAPPASLDRVFALRVTPLLRELIFTAFQEDATAERTELVVRLVLHELTETPDAPTFLPLPASTIGLRVADLAFADAGNQLDISDLADRAATSLRTISRLFPAETGLTYKAWRQRARIVLAMDQLSAGTPINQVAARAGFASTAAFCFAFRQVTSMIPTSFSTVLTPLFADAKPATPPPRACRRPRCRVATVA